jgi:hypothetical protein
MISCGRVFRPIARNAFSSEATITGPQPVPRGAFPGGQEPMTGPWTCSGTSPNRSRAANSLPGSRVSAQATANMPFSSGRARCGPSTARAIARTSVSPVVLNTSSGSRASSMAFSCGALNSSPLNARVTGPQANGCSAARDRSWTASRA